MTARESVWDYPRPPRAEPTPRRLTVTAGGRTVADTTRGWRVLETSHPPTYYIPPEDADRSLLRPNGRTSVCEFKGVAHYFDLVLGEEVRPSAAWAYPDPTPGFAPIAGHLCFYASRVDACTGGGEPVQAQPGDFYGGWITSDLEGPFKGAPGSLGW